MDKFQDELFKIKLDKLHVDDQIFINGMHFCIQYMKEEMNKCVLKFIDLKDEKLTSVLFSVMNRFFNFVIDSCYEKMMQKMDELIEYYEDQKLPDDLIEEPDDNVDDFE